MKKILLVLLLFSTIAGTFTVSAQDNIPTPFTKESKKRAWEFGIGASVYRLNRFSILDIYRNENGKIGAKIEKKDVLFGGNIYVGRELNDYFALDLQGFVGFTRDNLKTGKDNRWVIKPELGLQWRIGNYFNSKLIDPYLRASVGYMYKNFNIVYSGVENYDEVDVLWNVKNLNNKEGADKKHMVPISVGGGLNMWFNDRMGMGIQCMYVIKPYKHIANDIEGTVRWMWRFGGEPKKSSTSRSKRPVKVVEMVRDSIVEVPVYQLLYDLLDDIYFNFDQSTITQKSGQALDRIAEIMKEHTDKRFLIIGHTDAVGDKDYNLKLSTQRAKTVRDKLIERGVPKHQLKYRGVGMKMAMAGPKAGDKVRQGDRKVNIEIINNSAYWDYID